MKVYRYLLISVLTLSFLFSQLGKVPTKNNNSSPKTSKKGEIIKFEKNDDLKSELIELETRITPVFAVGCPFTAGVLCVCCPMHGNIRHH